MVVVERAGIKCMIRLACCGPQSLVSALWFMPIRRGGVTAWNEKHSAGDRLHLAPWLFNPSRFSLFLSRLYFSTSLSFGTDGHAGCQWKQVTQPQHTGFNPRSQYGTLLLDHKAFLHGDHILVVWQTPDTLACGSFFIAIAILYQRKCNWIFHLHLFIALHKSSPMALW